MVVPQTGFVNNTNQILNFNVYPIPAHQNIEYKLSNQLYGDYSIELQDVSGRVIHRLDGYKSAEMLKGSIDLSSFANGVYILKVQIGESFASKRIIKN